jgi:hypothetical protein
MWIPNIVIVHGTEQFWGVHKVSGSLTCAMRYCYLKNGADAALWALEGKME